MKKVKTIEIKNLQASEIEELTDSELMGVVGAGFATQSDGLPAYAGANANTRRPKG